MALLPQLTEEDVARHLDCRQMLVALEKALGDFSLGPAGGVVQPVRTRVALNDGFFGVMPGYSRDADVIACKLVSSYPNNVDVPSHHAIICLFDPNTGAPLALMGGEHITGARTAGASAVATKLLANPKSKKLAILGTGYQGKWHLEILRMLYEFEEVCVWNRTFAKAEQFALQHGCRACQTVQDAVKDADIICTLTSSSTPILEAAWVKPGAHINGVGACSPGEQELGTSLMREAVVYADSREACLQEAGDIILTQAEIYAEIGEVITGSKEAHPDKTTVFKSVGVAVEDVVTAKLVYDRYKAAQQDSADCEH